MLFVRLPPLSISWQRVGAFFGALGLIGGFAVLDTRVPAPLISNGLFIPFLGLVLFCLARSNSRIWTNSFFVQLGDASYSLYLLHIPIFVWLTAIDRKSFHLVDRNFTAFFICYLVVAIGASLISLNYVERPCRRMIRRRFVDASAYVAGSSQGMAHDLKQGAGARF
jgi:peptidoglycan/LPS O-acetylase OafA/YrhL